MSVSDYSFEIKQEALCALKSYAQENGNELCGVVTGSQIGDRTFRISKVSPPCVVKNTRCRCELDATKGNEFIKQDYYDSGQTRFYIGEWHTHPESNPYPSQTDCDSIVNGFTSADLCASLLIMIIVGTEHIYFSAYDGEKFTIIIPKIVDF